MSMPRTRYGKKLITMFFLITHGGEGDGMDVQDLFEKNHGSQSNYPSLGFIFPWLPCPTGLIYIIFISSCFIKFKYFSYLRL